MVEPAEPGGPDERNKKVSTRDHARTASGELYVETWGHGTPVVLVHGSLAVGTDEWDAQRPLAERGFSLTVPDRRGYGRSASAAGEDFLADAEDVAELLGDGAHLVGHSYGGVGSMLAAALRPDATLSLTLLEPAAAAVAEHDHAWRNLVENVSDLWRDPDLDDHDWVTRFLTSVGSDPEQLPPGLLEAALPLVPVCRRGRAFYEAELPFAELATASFPKLVVSGGHHDGFSAMCRDLARRIGGAHAVVEGAGHEIQFAGEPLNELLVDFWQKAPSSIPC